MTWKLPLWSETKPSGDYEKRITPETLFPPGCGETAHLRHFSKDWDFLQARETTGHPR